MTEVAIAFVAFVAGLTAFVFLNTAMERRGRYRPHLRRWDSTTAKLRRADVRPSPDDTDEMLRQLRRLEAVRQSPLSRVIGIGATLEEDGITAELLAIEVREAGGRVVFRAHANMPYRAGLHHETGFRLPPAPTIVDERGTVYAIGMSGWGGGGGGEAYTESQMEFVFVPAPPQAARTLRVSVPYLDPTGERHDAEHEPWVFEVAL